MRVTIEHWLFWWRVIIEEERHRERKYFRYQETAFLWAAQRLGA